MLRQVALAFHGLNDSFVYKIIYLCLEAVTAKDVAETTVVVTAEAVEQGR